MVATYIHTWDHFQSHIHTCIYVLLHTTWWISLISSCGRRVTICSSLAGLHSVVEILLIPLAEHYICRYLQETMLINVNYIYCNIIVLKLKRNVEQGLLFEQLGTYEPTQLQRIRSCLLKCKFDSQTNYIVDWLAESESHFLGHTIGIMWPINNLYTTVTWLQFIHCDDITRSSWPRKWEIPTY